MTSLVPRPRNAAMRSCAMTTRAAKTPSIYTKTEFKATIKPCAAPPGSARIIPAVHTNWKASPSMQQPPDLAARTPSAAK